MTYSIAFERNQGLLLTLMGIFVLIALNFFCCDWGMHQISVDFKLNILQYKGDLFIHNFALLEI